ncbi:hypothetical protein AKI73_00400 [Streptococcus pneumoniae]|nr:hypothetical protein AKI73_00400 [Streptococcus pneumoniae]
MMKRIYYHLLAIWAWTLPNSYAFIDSLKVFFPNISLQIAGSLLAVVSIGILEYIIQDMKFLYLYWFVFLF